MAFPKKVSCVVDFVSCDDIVFLPETWIIFLKT